MLPFKSPDFFPHLQCGPDTVNQWRFSSSPVDDRRFRTAVHNLHWSKTLRLFPALKPFCGISIERIDDASSSLLGVFLETSNMPAGNHTSSHSGPVPIPVFHPTKPFWRHIHHVGGNSRRRLNGILRSLQPYACQADTVLEGQGTF